MCYNTHRGGKYMTRYEVRKKIKEAYKNKDYCLVINGFFISIEEYRPICGEKTLYIFDGINIDYEDIEYIK